MCLIRLLIQVKALIPERTRIRHLYHQLFHSFKWLMFTHKNIPSLRALVLDIFTVKHPLQQDSFMCADAQKSPVISGGAKAWSYLAI
jgi:hypothetical protein